MARATHPAPAGSGKTSLLRSWAGHQGRPPPPPSSTAGRLRLHQLRLSGELAEIRAADLRFTTDETGELLASAGVPLSASGAALSLDPERTWFRYHHLFADLLRLELRRRLPAKVQRLHRRGPVAA